jgi:hypothetical protein
MCIDSRSQEHVKISKCPQVHWQVIFLKLLGVDWEVSHTIFLGLIFGGLIAEVRVNLTIDY